MLHNEISTENEIPEPRSYAEARDYLLSDIRRELLGPDNSMDEPTLLSETLRGESPLQKYKVGILYPKAEDRQDAEGIEKSSISTTELPQNPDEVAEASKVITKTAEEALEKIQTRPIVEDLPEENGLSDLAYSGLQRPASTAISFFLPENIDLSTSIKFSLSGGIYKKITTENTWVREPFLIESEVKVEELIAQKSTNFLHANGHASPINLRLKVFMRKYPGKGFLLTFSAINETPKVFNNKRLSNNMRCVFQTQLKAELKDATGTDCFFIAAYPKPEGSKDDSEEKSLELLYRNAETYAVGHGCSAAWKKSLKNGFVSAVWSTAFPEFETFGITSELKNKNGDPITVSMSDLSGMGDEDAGFSAIDDLIKNYQDWIKDKKSQAALLPSHFQPAAYKNLDLCSNCLLRIEEGLRFLKENENAKIAFRLANEAILIQQKRATDQKRNISVSNGTKRFDRPFESIETTFAKDMPSKGKWRPFQIAFLLLALKSSALGDAPDREAVDLIWFPTGGGKTEAYFGLAAFSILYRRLINAGDAGVSTIMRYTLRLLTADQFERASGLICALEFIRRRNPQKLGDTKFTIGIWLGKDTTPNFHSDAISNLKNLVSEKNQEGNKFLVTKCPWCSAQIGRVRSSSKNYEVFGYSLESKRVKIHCSDSQCDFHKELPIYVVDEDIYLFRPTLIIGTVDKFAQLAWNNKCRNIFGIDSDGSRSVSPPGLIIQDELHLISGPLGSMVGLYEALIEDLCTDYRQSKPIKPKIICSTATIRRSESQVRALYARSNALLFPSPGIEANDSFFAKQQPHELERGRKYVGVYAPGESIQTMQVRTMAITLQSVLSLPGKLRDPWWTLLAFFNSLRELGNTITLFQSDILMRLNALRRRERRQWANVRKLNNILELTSRLKNDEIDGVRNALKHTYTVGEKNYDVIDVCLASNIIEVGVDIGRLSLMTIVGQPKTTAQYIQVSGRVGRTPEKPGLILTIYGASKARDRSHFEKFISYHEKLYAQVEPTSVTPFSGPALERALHALIVGYLHQTLPESKLKSSWPIPNVEVADIIQKIKNRVRVIYQHSHDLDYILRDVEEYAEEFIRKWKSYETARWEAKEGEMGLLYRAGSYVDSAVVKRSFKTPQSMRNVDLECKGVIAYPMQKDISE